MEQPEGSQVKPTTLEEVCGEENVEYPVSQTDTNWRPHHQPSLSRPLNVLSNVLRITDII